MRSAADGAGGVGVEAEISVRSRPAPEVRFQRSKESEGAAHEVGLAGEELEGFGDLDGGGEVDGGGEDAGGVAGFDRAGGRLGEDAGEAGGGRSARVTVVGLGSCGVRGRMFMVAA